MKQLHLIIFLIVGSITTTFAQDKACNFNLTSTEIEQTIGSHQYLKVLRIDGKKGRVNYMEYTIVMRQGDEYKFNLRTPEGDANGIVFKVYDRRTKKRVVTNFSSGGLAKDFTYVADKTGIYDIQISFKGSKSYCGVCICSHKKNIN
ncbi:MAG: hypothetical protein ACPGJS_04140 [Flammeovirgaceae bacterium]